MFFASKHTSVFRFILKIIYKHTEKFKKSTHMNGSILSGPWWNNAECMTRIRPKSFGLNTFLSVGHDIVVESLRASSFLQEKEK